MSLRCVVIVLALLVIAEASIASACAGQQAIIVPTCEARLATLKRDVSPSVIQSLKLMPAALSHIVSTLLHGPVLASSTLEPSLFPHGRWPQDQLHDLLHVFLC